MNQLSAQFCLGLRMDLSVLVPSSLCCIITAWYLANKSLDGHLHLLCQNQQMLPGVGGGGQGWGLSGALLCSWSSAAKVPCSAACLMPSCSCFLVFLLSTLFTCPRQQEIGMLPSAVFQEASESSMDSRMAVLPRSVTGEPLL